MAEFRKFLWAAAAIAACSPAAAEAAGVAEVLAGFKPYRAVYDMSLGSSTDDSTIESISGRIVTEFTGNTCDGFTTSFRFVSRIDSQDGASKLSDLRTSSYEAADGDTFQFVSQDYDDRKLVSEAKGVATRGTDATIVDLTKPADRQIKLSSKILFPTWHMAEIVSHAEDGKLVFQADLFDGGEKGERALPTTAIIGQPIDGAETPDGDDPKAVTTVGGGQRWPVRLSYFDPDADPGEQTPMYALSFLLYANGISRKLSLDYGDFTIVGRLVEVDMLDPAPCDKP